MAPWGCFIGTGKEMQLIKPKIKRKGKRPRWRHKRGAVKEARKILMQGIQACTMREREWGVESRVHQTPAQRRYGDLLRQIDARHSFRCEQPLFGYRMDFYAPFYLLDVEIDGGYHNDPKMVGSDLIRTKKLNKKGISVLRFTNEEVLNDSIGVIKRTQHRILACCKVNKFKKKLRKKWLTEQTDVNKEVPLKPMMIDYDPTFPHDAMKVVRPITKPVVILRKAVAVMPEARA